MDKVMYRDKRGLVVPQILTENGYEVLSVGDMEGVDITKYKLLVDKRGKVLPYQYFDADEKKFVSGFPPGIGGGGGSVELSNSLNSNSTLTAATSSVAKRINDKVEGKVGHIDSGSRMTGAYDTFNRADGDLTTSEDGQNYQLSGTAGSFFKVINKTARLRALGNGYMSLESKEEKIETIGAEWYWNKGTTQSTVAIVITNDQYVGQLTNLLHFITNTKEWYLQVRHAGTNGNLPTVIRGRYDKDLKMDGTIYRFEMTVEIDNKMVYLRLPDGNVASYTGEEIPIICGKRAYWQVIRNRETDEEPCYTSIWLTEKKGRTLGSTKENLNILPAVSALKKYVDDKTVNKVSFSFVPTEVGYYRLLQGITEEIGGTVRLYTANVYNNSIANTVLDFSIGAFASANINQTGQSGYGSQFIDKVRVGYNNDKTLVLDININNVSAATAIVVEFTGKRLIDRITGINSTFLKNPPIHNPAVTTYSRELALGRGLRTNGPISASVIESELEIVTNAGNNSMNVNCSYTALDATNGNIVLSLLSSLNNKGHVHTYSRIDGTANTVTIVGYFSDGSTTKVLTRNGTPLKIIANHNTNQWILI